MTTHFPRKPRAFSGLLLITLTTAGLLAPACPTAAPQSTSHEGYSLGRPAEPDAIARIDIDVMPDGRGLPAGSGSALEGKVIYETSCSHCHGSEGRDGPNGSLAGVPLYSVAELAGDRSLKRTVGNYWPHATTLFDYLRRAMPFDKPGSLSSDELYAVTAYVLHLNDLVDEQATLDATTLPLVEMPARERFRSARVAEEQP